MLGTPEIKQGIVLLWALWLSLVTLMNLSEALRAMRLLPEGFALVSSNWSLMRKVTEVYHTPVWLVALMFAGVIVVEAWASVLLWRGFWERSLEWATFGLGLCLALWAGFILASQLFKSFVVNPEIPAAHRSLFNTFLISLLALHLL